MPTPALWRNRRLLWELTRRDLRERYIASAGGWMWLLARPALSALAYLFVFDAVFRLRPLPETGTAHFGVFLLAGLIPFMFFIEEVTRGATSLVEAAHLLKKTVLPIELFPARAVLSAALVYLPIVLAFFVIQCWQQADRLLVLPLLVVWFLGQAALGYALALALSLLTAAVRDVEQAVGLVAGVLVFFTPVFYTLAQVPEGFRALMWLNPATPIVLGYQALLLEGRLPDITVVIAAAAWIAGGFALAGLLLRRSRDQVADWL